VLRSEYEAVRNKVYGAGPREVRLSQDALEVLALVAYQQPISHAGVEASGKKNAGNLLRQLLRRELVAISRVDKSRDGVQYHTTPRFLSLFGLGNLDELPQADGLNLR
jgi:segregation and condensation protein B